MIIDMQKKEFSKDNTLALKGIAIIMMIFHHCFRTVKLFRGYEVSFFPLNQDLVLTASSFFKICVSVFAFVTGYGLCISLKKINSEYKWNKKEIIDWIKTRLIRTLSGYWIIVVLAWIINQIIDGRTYTVYFKDGVISGIVQMINDFCGISNLFGTASLNSSWWYMSIAILFVFSVPLFMKLFKKFGYFPIIIAVIAIPRILGWKYVNSSYISFLFPLLLGIIFAEKNLMVRIANFKICKNACISKIIKFIIESASVLLLYYVYNCLNTQTFWEIRYGIIPVIMMCYIYEFFIDLPVLKIILKFLGKHSMNIFLVHEFIRSYYLKDYVYSFRNFVKIGLVILGISLIISIMLELFKKMIFYDKLINKIQTRFSNRIKE